ncbi:MAG: helix-turn-helix domain-containing protein [Bacteroidia bacterium]
MQNVILTQLSIEQLQHVINDAVQTGLAQFKPTQPEQTNLLTRKQVCQLLNITPPTLHEWTRNGTITAYKVGTRVRYKHNEVLNTLNRIQQTKVGRGA